MRILVIDPAQSTGYAIVEVNETNSTANIIDYGFIELADAQYAGDKYIELRGRLEVLVENNGIQEVTVEDYFFSRKTCQGGTLNASYRCVCHMVARDYNLHYEVLNISLWKKFINGRTTPTKEQKALWGKEEAKKLMTQEKLWTRWGIRFPNHSISSKTGKPVKPKSDIVDAVGMAIFYVSIYKNIRTVTCSVKPSNDVEWKKTPKGVLDYDSIDEVQ